MDDAQKQVVPAGSAGLLAGIESQIFNIRGLRVMLAADLAAMDKGETRVLRQAVQRNLDRFPADFAFPLSDQAFAILRSQTVTSRWGGSRGAIAQLMDEPPSGACGNRPIGFTQDSKDK